MPKKPSRAEAKLARQRTRHEALLLEELPLWSEGLVVAGLDEAGAGPLAGPVTAACVVLDPAQVDALIGVDDSKTLDAATREQHATRIRAHVRAWAVAEATVGEIDRINIREAGLLAMKRALDRVLEQVPEIHHLLVDARIVPGTPFPPSDRIKGDARSLSIAAASILAKGEPDLLMTAAPLQWAGDVFEGTTDCRTTSH